MGFWQPLQKFVGKGQKFLAQSLKLIQKFKKFIFLLIVPMDKLKTVSTTTPKIFRWKAETNWLNVRKIFENFNFVERKRLRKKFSWRRRVGFWQPLQKFVGKRPENSCSKSQIDTKIQKLHFPSYFPYGQVENSLDNNAENFPTKGQKSLSQCAIMNRKYTFSQKISFISNCSSGHVECSFQDPSEKFSIKKCQTNFAQCPKKIQNAYVLQ